MEPLITSNLREALQQQVGPLEVHDQLTNRDYIVLPKEDYQKLVRHEFRQWLQVGIDQAEQGVEAEWDTGEFIAEARRRFQPRDNS
ncbi:MAG: hypothetical protein JNM18_25125 [Planctomycetaceae bacterium]|nr:hypothetical protein [Planctomycetaceae bacterium]